MAAACFCRDLKKSKDAALGVAALPNPPEPDVGTGGGGVGIAGPVYGFRDPDVGNAAPVP